MRERRFAAVWIDRSTSAANQLTITVGGVKMDVDVIVTFPLLKGRSCQGTTPRRLGLG